MISLTVPIYNEEGSIEELFEKVRKVIESPRSSVGDHFRQ